MDNQNPNQTIFNQQSSLPNSTAVLVLGIISIVGCFCYGIVGLICGIIALVLASKDSARLNTTPELYTEGSIKNLKAGKVCAIVGVSLSALYLIFVIFLFATVGMEALKHPGSFRTNY